MHETKPQVRLLASPKVQLSQLADYLVELNAIDWMHEYLETNDNPLIDGDLLAEVAGRLCYRSWAPGMNPNVTRVRTDHESYIGNILNQGHGAVLEHAQYTFILTDVSRVFTHELVRHRAGVAVSQESLRYVRLTDLGFRVPQILTDHPAWEQVGEQAMGLLAAIEAFQRDAAEAFGLDEDGVDFHFKKEVTSALRRFAPLGVSTSMVWSANIRTLRHVIALRTHPSAEEEIRVVFAQVADLMQEVAPFAFQDMLEGDDELHRVFQNQKV